MSEARADIENLIAMIPSATKAADGRRVISDSWTTSVATKSVGSEAEVYVFNFKDSLGYAIVSNDARIGLIGLAMEGSFDSSSEITNPGLIVALSNAGPVYSESIRTRGTSTTTESDPYNYKFKVTAVTGIRR